MGQRVMEEADWWSLHVEEWRTQRSRQILCPVLRSVGFKQSFWSVLSAFELHNCFLPSRKQASWQMLFKDTFPCAKTKSFRKLRQKAVSQNSKATCFARDKYFLSEAVSVLRNGMVRKTTKLDWIRSHMSSMELKRSQVVVPILCFWEGLWNLGVGVSHLHFSCRTETEHKHICSSSNCCDLLCKPRSVGPGWQKTQHRFFAFLSYETLERNEDLREYMHRWGIDHISRSLNMRWSGGKIAA